MPRGVYSHVERSIRLAEAVLVTHVQHWWVIERVPKLVDEAVGENLLNLGVIIQTGDDLNGPLHDHGLVILLSLTLGLGLDNFKQRLEVYNTSANPLNLKYTNSPLILRRRRSSLRRGRFTTVL